MSQEALLTTISGMASAGPLREAFSRWHQAHIGNADPALLSQLPSGRYFSPETQQAWEGFLGAMALATLQRAAQQACAWEIQQADGSWTGCNHNVFKAAHAAGRPSRELVPRTPSGRPRPEAAAPSPAAIDALARSWTDIGDQLQKGGPSDRAVGLAYRGCAAALRPPAA